VQSVVRGVRLPERVPIVQDNKIDFSAHMRRERRNTFYHLLNPDAPHNSMTDEFDTGVIGFPDCQQVLFLHSFDRIMI